MNDHLVNMVLMNSSKLKFSSFYIFNYLNSSFKTSSGSFSPDVVITFLNYFIVMVGPFGLNIEIIASISSSSVYGSLYSLNYQVNYLAINARNEAKSNLPLAWGSICFAHLPNYYSVGVWYKDLIRMGRTWKNEHVHQSIPYYHYLYRIVGSILWIQQFFPRLIVYPFDYFSITYYYKFQIELSLGTVLFGIDSSK